MTKMLLSLTLFAFATLAFASSNETHWTYEDPANWGKLSPDFSLCETGKNQSPIDIANTLAAESPDLKIKYKSTPADVVNNGHTIQINVPSGSSLTLQNHVYALKQVHFHSPSENTIDGKSYPLEAHFVHADEKGNLAVIAVMFNKGKSNKALAQAWAIMPTATDTKTEISSLFNPTALLPKKRYYYRFNGSLTTPPCTEGVTWLVLKRPITASQAQINQFVGAMGHTANNRPVQPINARPILK
jgi:carbonic anhydrase